MLWHHSAEGILRTRRRPQDLVVFAMSIAVSPMATEAVSPMITTVTPTVEPRKAAEEEEEEGRGGELAKEAGPAQRYDKPPPLHTGADWKVVLHLPEIETWLRCTADRVRDLTHSVHQDAHNKHVDVHLVQLKDICEDISDHVEQIHALLETEFSLKLLSYSVNIIVDIRTVQLLWHQLRVSVLVLKERVLQGLQDSNGNYTRQTDILQAFSQDQTEARLDALTEVDDSGQLTIKCSQNYLSLDCGITACELSDYSPSEDLPIELEAMTSSRTKAKTHETCFYPDLEKDFPELIQSVGLLAVAAERLSSKQDESPVSGQDTPLSSTPQTREESKATSGKPPLPQGNTEPPGEDLALADNVVMSPIKHQGVPRSRHASHCENPLSKRPIRDCFNYNEVSPTQPSMPKKAMYLEGMSSDDTESIIKRAPPSSLQFKGDMSRSTPSLLDPPDRSKFWLELTSVYPRSAPSAVSQSYDCLNTMSDKIHKGLANGTLYKRVQGQAASNPSLQGSTSEAEQPSSLADHPSPPEQLGCAHVVGFQESCNEMKSSPLNVSSPEGSDLTPPDHRKGLSATIPETSAHSPDSKSLPVATKEHLPSTCNGTETKKEPWYGSDEYLALPSQLKKTEMLAMKLENLAKVLPQKPMEETFQDVDDWELSEVNSDCDGYLPLRLTRVSEKPFPGGRLSPTSSSDIAPSLDESIESGPLSDLLSEDEVNAADLSVKQKARDLWLVKDPSQAEETSLGRTALIQQLLDDIQHQENYEDIWEKIEGFVGKLDEFIQWLHEALETTENWTPPKAETTCLKLYLETHLSFKLNVDSHCALKDTVVEEGRQLLEFIVSHKSGLKDMLQMIVNQWQELQRQIRRQHSWILRALEIIKAEILASDVSHEAESGAGSPEGEAQRWHHETQQDVLEQLSLRVHSERFSSRTERKREFAEMSKVNRIGSNSLLDFESEYQELWDWLMDMESIVMDSHDLMMSEEQQQHLYKGNSVEMAMWFPRKTQLLSRVESLRRSATSLPADFEDRVSALTQKWDLLEKTLEERTGGQTGAQAGLGPCSLLSPETNGLVRQLESRIKELRGWLRDTELLIFNSCLRQEKAEAEAPHAPKQLQYFKSLCGEIRQRRRGVSSVLRLCQRLLEEQDSSTPDTERQALQLVTVNLERRWEAIVMQALQWQTRLQKRLGTEQVPGNVIEPAFMDLNTSAEDSWEWDDTDISNDLISVNMEPHDLEQVESHTSKLTVKSPGSRAGDPQFDQYVSQHDSPSCGSGFTPPSSSPRVYQVYSLHNVELYERPHLPFLGKSPQDSSQKQPNTLMKSLSKDSSFSSTESLPDLLGGVGSVNQGGLACSGDSARRSESESGIVSEGDTETTANSEVCPPNRVDEPRGELSSEPPVGVDEPESSLTSNEVKMQSALNRSGSGGIVEHVDVSVSCTSRGILQANYQKTPAEKKKRASIDQPSEGHPVAIILNGQEPLAEGDSEGFKQPLFTRQDDERGCADLKSGKQSAFLSHGSSLDSLSVAGDLFLSGKDTLHRSTSLESWLAPCKSTEEISSQHSLGDLGFGGDSTGELSKRTLELLKRLENIPSPFNHKMKRSISDITLQSSSLKMPASTQLPLEVASSVNEDSAASLTELSSSEDLSLCSEDIAVQKNRIVDSNASFRKHVNHVVPDEADVSISMIVNVSCTSACTDDDEDDSDLLSSSTLTLTEEELGIKDDDDSSIASDEEYIESSFALGLDYMKNELQNWIKPRISQSKEKNELGDELQCGALSRENITSSFTANERRFLNRSALKLLEANANGKSDSLRPKASDISKVSQEKSRSYMNQFVDDMENGNVENSQLKAKDADDELLREEESLITKSGESLKDCYASDLGTGSSVGVVTGAKSFQCDLLSTQPKESSLECQLSGEIPCCSSDREPSSVLPMSNRQGSHKGTVELTHNDGISDSFAIFRKDAEEISDSIAEVPSCCSHHSPVEEGKNEDDGSVHNFVMEIIDMASVALKNKTLSDPQAPSPTPVAQIRDKVLEHSHRPIQLRKGDFYSYLSLSSHDSDCGEVSTCVEDKSSTPLPPDLGDTLNMRDEELLFKPCTEQVYIGPPLSYSMCMSQRTPKSTGQGHSCHAKPRGSVSSSHQNGTDRAPKPHCTENQKAPGISKGGTARSQLECHNEASYLNPLPCETLIDTVECFSDTKMLESNISPVMTKIRVSCSSTNPLKEEDSLYINPKINCPQIRKFDRDEKGPASQRMKQKHIKKGCSSQQETKSAHKQLSRPEAYSRDDGKKAKGSTTCPDSSGTSASQPPKTTPEWRAVRPLTK
ncbi:A-kinase anchor protein 6 isoform X2 [Lepisosteus oculatus]|uniref:A-kinase anchor protein 6 isoform X2 n=1 Tax=Lepisosteus oculatus TaxID=7918 RepID=UPI003720ABF5